MKRHAQVQELPAAARFSWIDGRKLAAARHGNWHAGAFQQDEMESVARGLIEPQKPGQTFACPLLDGLRRSLFIYGLC
jgi:hypothetical protein